MAHTKPIAMLLALSAGCSLYDGGDGSGGGGTCGSGASVRLFDPSALTCDTIDLEHCDDFCVCTTPPSHPLPWGSCTSACLGLNDAQCTADLGCRSAFYDPDIGSGSQSGSVPLGCYPLDTDSAAVGDCATLDVEECATRHDCAAIYTGSDSAYQFYTCGPGV